MDSANTASSIVCDENILNQILTTLQSIQSDYQHLAAAVDTIEGRINLLAGVNPILGSWKENIGQTLPSKVSAEESNQQSLNVKSAKSSPNKPLKAVVDESHETLTTGKSSSSRQSTSLTSRIILTTYPGQSGVDPLKMNWGHSNPFERGPVIVSRSQSTIRRRNGTKSVGDLNT